MKTNRLAPLAVLTSVLFVGILAAKPVFADNSISCANAAQISSPAAAGQAMMEFCLDARLENKVK